ncbi:MAG TPA: WXG100 family type VII secretion target, partial [Pseudonocardiaceae bacterium]|nr:WXG100 family type VII secretion target [Pseudonocardiaceae bacterium]
MGSFGGLATSDEALDGAAGFQEGFREYLPLYNDYTGSALSLAADIQRPYDELREIDFRRLSGVAEEGAAVAGELQETRAELNATVAGVTSWSGDAANAFLAHLQRYQAAAQTIDDELGEIATTTGDAVRATRTVVAEYVETIGEIDFSGFDPPELVRILITIERMAMPVSELIDRLYDGIGDLIGMALPVFSSGGGGLFGSIPGVSQVVDAASDVFGDLVGGVLDFFGGADELLALASRLAREYLDASFRTPFENNLQLLDSAVQTATEGVTEAFRPMMDAAAAVTQEGFTALGEAPEDNPAVVPAGGGTPVTSEGGSVPLGASSPAGGSPEPPLPPTGTVAPTVPSAIATQPGDADQPRDVSIPPAVDQPGGAPSQVNMRLGDLTITVSGTDGTSEAIGVTLTDGDGDSRRYEIRIDADGNPQLVPVEPGAAQPGDPPGRPGGPDLPTVAASAQAAVSQVQPGLPTAVEPAAFGYGYADRPDFTTAPLAAESAIGQPATTTAADSSASGTVVGGQGS